MRKHKARKDGGRADGGQMDSTEAPKDVYAGKDSTVVKSAEKRKARRRCGQSKRRAVHHAPVTWAENQVQRKKHARNCEE